jgi:large subunit ribosomal protein L44e
MKMPRRINMYCPNCGKHTSHTVSQARKRARGELRKGHRRFRRKVKPTGKTRGARGFPKSSQKSQKPTKKQDLRYRCSVCNKSQTKPCFRAKTLEFTD